jgi:AcrR family transcriptional regulator
MIAMNSRTGKERQAGDTRRRIVNAARQLLQSAGYDGMTIEAIAQRAEVSPQSVHAIFQSKTGILAELLDQSTFGDEYEEAVRQALSARDPETRLRLVAALPGRSMNRRVPHLICCEVRVRLRPTEQNCNKSEKACAMNGRRE